MHSKKLFVKALNKKFGKDFDLGGQKTEYKRLGPDQSARKREFIEYAKKLEGKRGIPRNRPPRLAEKGYLGRPTIVKTTYLGSLERILQALDAAASPLLPQTAEVLEFGAIAALYDTTLGKKAVMAATGIVLFLFVIQVCKVDGSNVGLLVVG